ncbi:MAG TPA: sulfite exporter TauE/SafE family protein [bacterium]|nr:sulfite exporter TauE/SafE family protein [bacterium]
MITDPGFYLVAIPAILLTCVAKGAFGVGLGILAVPLIALTLPIGQTTGILLPLLLLMDLFGLYVYWGKWDGAVLRPLVAGALMGIAVGTATFHLVSEEMIRLLLGTIALVFTLHYFLRGRLSTVALRPTTPVGLAAGTVSGFTSFVSHAGAPPVAVYLLPQRLDKTLYTATTVLYFALVNLAKLVPYAWLGLLSRGNLETAAVLTPLVPLGIVLGVLVHRLVSMSLFYRICYGFVFIAGVKLLYDGLLPLIAG